MKTNNKKLNSILIGIILLTGTFVNYTQACTGIRLIAKDGAVVYSRTMEWGAFDLHSRIAVIPQGFSFTGITPDGENGMKWEGLYGFVGIDMLSQDAYADGVNEKGLAAGLFYHPGFASYPEYNASKADITISAKNVISFILSQYATIEEVRKGMNKVMVVPVVEEALGIPVAAHWMIASPEGESIVIEFTDGKMKIFDDPLGIITNAPTFDWHMTNLRNYVNLSAVALPDKKIDDIDFAPLGGGSGMIGLPGDFTPPSRFVRAVAWTQTARPTANAYETVYEVFRILDNFNVPLHAAEGSDGPSKLEGMRSSTIWTSAWDLKDHILYYHTQNNRRIRAFDFEEIDFSNLGNDIIHILEVTPFFK